MATAHIINMKQSCDNGVVMMCLPTHTINESQPLDASVFKPLKQNWHAACHRNPGKVITKYTPLLNETWSNAMIPTVIAYGVECTYLTSKHLIMGQAKAGTTEILTATSNANSQATSTSITDAESLLPTFTSEEEKHFQR